MMRHKFAIGAFAVAFALSTLPASGQEKGGGGSSRPSGGSESSGSAGSRSSGSGSSTGGTAVSRGGGGADSGGSTSRSSGGGMSGGSMGSSSSPSMPSSSGFGMAPQRSSANSGQSRPSGSKSNGGESTGRSAVPRGGSSSDSGSREGGSVRSGGSTTSRDLASSGSSDRANDTGRRAVPAYSRPRDGRPTTGVAVDRGLAPAHPISGINGDNYYIYRPYYYPYGFWGSAYGFGLGYLYYDPFWYGGYGGYGYPGYSYGGGYGGGSYSTGSYSQTYRDTGNLRLKIKPREAQVYIDGYFVGVVDSFDGSFQRLSLDGGGHKVEIKADGYEALLLDVMITPGETVTYKGDMKRIQ